MKGREGKGPPSTDLLVCFPSRTRIALMPKPICSPVRPTGHIRRQNHNHHHHHHQNHHQQVTRSSNRGVQGSPLLWAKTKPMGSDISSEPTSPKVTCAGQIKVRSKPNSCKNWQSVMEEIERLHNNKKHKKKPSWVESLGLKKDAMQFLACLRGLRVDFRCFGSFNGNVVVSSDDDEEEEEEEEEEEYQEVEQEEKHEDESSKAIFAKWFMVLEEENQEHHDHDEGDKNNKNEGTCVPPSNALLLMRCRSAPAKSWLEEKQEQEREMKTKLDLEEEKEKEEEKKKKDNLILKCYAPDFFKVSCDIAKETWIVGGAKDPFSRSRSWKR